MIVRDGRIVGEGYHHKAGSAHAEAEALRQAGARAEGATLYVSLEPCNHTGKTPPCSEAVITAKIARAVIGAADPNPRTAGGGIAALERAGIAVEVADFPAARMLIEPFTGAMQSPERPYIALKMAASLDAYVTSRTGVQQWLTGPAARDAVRELRIRYDAVMVGAGTIRTDDPQLTVRPAHVRLRSYARIVVCETESLAPSHRVFVPAENYERTVVLAPGGNASAFAGLQKAARVVPVGNDTQLDLTAAMRALRELGIQSVLCEGGPTLAGRLLALGLVDRLYWLVSPQVLATPDAVAALNPPAGAKLPSIAVDTVERLGDDLMLSGTVQRV